MNILRNIKGVKKENVAEDNAAFRCQPKYTTVFKMEVFCFVTTLLFAFFENKTKYLRFENRRTSALFKISDYIKEAVSFKEEIYLLARLSKDIERRNNFLIWMFYFKLENYCANNICKNKNEIMQS